MTNEAPGSGVESRARAILGLNDLEDEPRALPIRVDRMWRAENFAAHVANTGSILIPLGHAPDMGICRQAVAAVVRRHEALHSCLAVVKDRAVMCPTDPQAGGFEVVKHARSDIERYGRRLSALSEFFTAPINLFEDTGFRCRAFQDEDENVTLGVLMHHYYGDAWSSQVLRREIETAYAAIARGVAPDWEPPAQYGAYALSQRRALAKDLPAELAHWQQRLANARPTELPFDCSGDANRMGRAVFSILPETLAKLTLLSRSERLSLSVLCFAAFQLTLAHWCGQTQAVAAATFADRMQPQFRDTIGRLMGGIPICSEVPDTLSIREYLSALAKDFYGAMAHRDLAFEQYDEIFSPPAPFCTTRFNFIPNQAEFLTGGDGAPRPDISGIVKLADGARGEAHSDMFFVLMQYPDGLVGRVSHSLNFSSEKIEAFIGAFRRILDKITGNPGGKLGELR